MNFFYQVWDLHGLKGPQAGKKLQVDYAYGRMGAHDTQTIHDEIPLDQLDAGGSILNGKRVVTAELQPGNYRLVMTLSDPETQSKVFGSLSFTVSSTNTAVAPWDVSDDSAAASVASGNADYERALCYLALGDKAHTEEFLGKAHSKNASDERYKAKLTEIYFGRQEYSQVTQLYTSGITQGTDEQTILRIAESFDKTGESQEVGRGYGGRHQLQPVERTSPPRSCGILSEDRGCAESGCCGTERQAVHDCPSRVVGKETP